MKNRRKTNLSLLKLIFASGTTCAFSFLTCKVLLAIPIAGFTPWNPPTVTYYFSSSLPLPNNDFKNRVRESAQTWNVIPNSNLRFSETSTPDSTAVNQGVITYQYIDGTPSQKNRIAETSFIKFATPPNPNPSRFKINFDTADAWYSLAGQPPNTQFDAKSLATHEFGHAVLLDHTNATPCPTTPTTPDSALFATMCPDTPRGRIFMRSLAADDKLWASTLY